MAKLSGAEKIFDKMVTDTANDKIADDDSAQALLPLPGLMIDGDKVVKRTVGKRGTNAATRETIELLKRTGHTDPLIACQSYIDLPLEVLAKMLKTSSLIKAAEIQRSFIALALPHWHARRAPENAQGEAMPEFNIFAGSGTSDQNRDWLDMRDDKTLPIIEVKTVTKQRLSKNGKSKLEKKVGK